jgi:hypothetical protein
MPPRQRQPWVFVVGGCLGGGGGGGVGVFANQKQWPRGVVRRGEKDLVELVAGIFHGGGVSVEMGKCTRVVVVVVDVVVGFGLLALVCCSWTMQEAALVVVCRLTRFRCTLVVLGCCTLVVVLGCCT